MLYTVYYIIKPKPSLLVKLSQVNETIILLNEPMVWVKEEGGVTTFNVEAYIIQVKLTFLAYVHFQGVRQNNSRYRQIISSLLGPVPIQYQRFDNWWYLERLELSNEYDLILENIPKDSFQSLSHTGISVLDNWLTSFVEHKYPDKK